MTLLNGKNFDTSFIVDRFNRNQDVLLEDIAEEFGITRDELVDRCKKGASADEKPRVKQMVLQNGKRKKRLERKQAKEEEQRAKEAAEMQEKKKLEEQADIAAETTDGNKETDMAEKDNEGTIDEQRERLVKDIEVAKADLKASAEKAQSLKEIVAESGAVVTKHRKEAKQCEKAIREAETRIAASKKRLDELTAQLLEEATQFDADKKALDVAQAEVSKRKEDLEWLEYQLEDLESRVVFLIDPSYDTALGLPENGRLISNAELDGVEFEVADSDIDDLGFGQILSISRKTGFADIIELGAAYEFAYLAKKYLGDSRYEAQVITRDSRVTMLIDLVMADSK